MSGLFGFEYPDPNWCDCGQPLNAEGKCDYHGHPLDPETYIGPYDDDGEDTLVLDDVWDDEDDPLSPEEREKLEALWAEYRALMDREDWDSSLPLE